MDRLQLHAEERKLRYVTAEAQERYVNAKSDKQAIETIQAHMGGLYDKLRHPTDEPDSKADALYYACKEVFEGLQISHSAAEEKVSATHAEWMSRDAEHSEALRKKNEYDGVRPAVPDEIPGYEKRPSSAYSFRRPTPPPRSTPPPPPRPQTRSPSPRRESSRKYSSSGFGARPETPKPKRRATPLNTPRSKFTPRSNWSREPFGSARFSGDGFSTYRKFKDANSYAPPPPDPRERSPPRTKNDNTSDRGRHRTRSPPYKGRDPFEDNSRSRSPSPLGFKSKPIPTGPNGNPNPKPASAFNMDITTWLGQVDKARQDRQSSRRFPEAPSWSCGYLECTAQKKDRTLAACSHNLRTVLTASGVSLKRLIVQFHPDKFSDSLRDASTEVFKVVNELYDNSKKQM